MPSLADLRVFAVLALLASMAACTPGPEPIDFGRDSCAYCKMTISDERFGAELVTKKGKVYPFDSVECLAAHQLEGRIAPDDVHSRWVVDFQNPPNLVRTDEAFFLHSEQLRSPMGMNLTAFGPEIRRDAVLNSFFGEILDWQQVLGLVRSNWHNDADAMRPANP